MKLRGLIAGLTCAVILSVVSGCSNQPDTTTEVTQIALEDKYSDISKRLVYLSEVAETNVTDLLRFAFGYKPIDLPIREDAHDAYMYDTSDPFITDYTIITDRYSGYDWTNNLGIIILKLENEEGTEFLTIKAVFDEDNKLASSSVVASYTVTLDSSEDTIIPAPAIGY